MSRTEDAKLRATNGIDKQWATLIPILSGGFISSSLWIRVILILTLIGTLWSMAPPSSGKCLSIQLSRIPLTVLNFPSQKQDTSAIILFASGDGGWGSLEEAISRSLQDQGYEVIGIDSKIYARTDYNLEILQSDFRTIAQAARARFGSRPPPLIVGGYSMGAAQAIAVGAGPDPPHGLRGLLLVDPLSRGRYGLRSSDQMNVLPVGPGTFSVDSFSRTMHSVRVVQWHAEDDPIDSRVWLDDLAAEHESFTFRGTGHFYETNRQQFVRMLVDSVAWILESPRNGILKIRMDAGI